MWTRLLVAANNFLAGGRPEAPTLAEQLLRSQELLVDRFERQVAAWVRLGSGPRRELDRAVRKFSVLEDQLSDLRRRSQALLAQFQPYSKNRGLQAAQCEPREPEVSFVPTALAPHTSGKPASCARKMPKQTSSLNVDPDRLVFDYQCLPQF